MASFTAWQQWARWGSLLPPVPELVPEEQTATAPSPDSTLNPELILEKEVANSTPPDLTAVRRVVDAFQCLVQFESQHLQQLLLESGQYLAPLSDPLRSSARKNRWLDLQREREESYTDWLASLLQEMGSAKSMLSVFGLDGTEFGAKVGSAPPRVSREEPIHTDDGEIKRLDLVIRFGKIGILLVEVKVRRIEEAGGSDNLPVYLSWLKSWEPTANHAILLVPLAESIESPCDGWDVRGWDELCLRLRAQAIALRKAAPNNLNLASLLLSFAGAVEQNVLGLTGAEVASAAPETARYLERFLEENRL